MIGIVFIALLFAGLTLTAGLVVRDSERRRQATVDENHRLRAQLLAQPGGSQPASPPPPPVCQVIHKIAVVGLTGVGKTTLTHGLLNPLLRSQDVVATIQETYQRVVSRVHDPVHGGEVNHVFMVLDWGGEFRNRAQSALLQDPLINAVLFVVDLDATRRGADWLERQSASLDPQALRFFFTTEALKHCATFVLFINKTDLLSGTAVEVEAVARQRYAGLIAEFVVLQHRHPEAEVQVMVGSASSGHSTTQLHNFLIRRLLPETAYEPDWRRGGESVGADDADTLK